MISERINVLAPVVAAGHPENLKLRRPCANCPWRVDAPRGYWDPLHFLQIWRRCQDDGANMMACHKSTRGSFLPCQGWVRVLGFGAIGVRIAVMSGRVSRAEVRDRGGPALFSTFEAMLRANQIPIPPRNHRPPPRVPRAAGHPRTPEDAMSAPRKTHAAEIKKVETGQPPTDRLRRAHGVAMTGPGGSRERARVTSDASARRAKPRRQSAQSDVDELLARAFQYDDKPHQLYSHIAAMAERREPDREVRAKIRRLMDEQYNRASTSELAIPVADLDRQDVPRLAIKTRRTATAVGGAARGRIVRLTTCSSFKLAIVIGASSVPGKLRVQTYSHAGRGWSHPHAVAAADVSEPAVAEMTAGQRRTLGHATADIAKSNLRSGGVSP